MNQKERKQFQLERHYQALQKLASLCGVDNANGKNLSNKLRQIESIGEKAALDYCNGDISSEQSDFIDVEITGNVQYLFNNNLKHFFVNSDYRGYALKIKTEYTQELRNLGIELQTDWGGYGLLAPEITGK
jgi:5'-3' exonuclease